MTDELGNIIKFRGEHSWLSNFHDCETPIELPSPDYNKYPTVEHAYQAAKTKNMVFRDMISRGTPTEAKRFYKNRKKDIREDWEDIKLTVMEYCLRQKYSKELNPKLHKKLIDTGNVEIIEGNQWHDVWWGQCPIGVGKNNLGKLIMKIRGELQCQK